MLLRPDLVHRRISMGRHEVWVLKDPLSRQLFYFSDQELELLKLADGCRSIQEIAEECRARFAPLHFSTESLVRFYADAKSKGVLKVAETHHRASALDQQSKTHRNPLAIRLPGINPDRLLDFFVPWVRPLVSPVFILVATFLIVAAAFLVIVNFSSFATDVKLATNRLSSGQGLALLLFVISVTKIIHELAHAFACKMFGGECRELGVMLLVGVPCLYCDVSDAWMMKRRWKRIFVSAAGMLTELTLAALATFLWLVANDGVVQDLCVMVMFVCSVTTLLFNGNPLLRYDGYYMLSDLTGIPNLAAESSNVIRQRLRCLLWSLPKPVADVSQNNSGNRGFLAVYGVVSGSYRLLVYGLICLMLYRVAESYELGAIAGALVLALFVHVVYRMVAPVMSAPKRIRSEAMRKFRPAVAVLMVGFFVFAICICPLPRRVVAPMSIQPSDAKAVFVARGGQIRSVAKAENDVSKGEVIAQLENQESLRELAELESKCDQLAIELESLHSLRGLTREASDRIPTLEKMLEESVSRKTAQQRITQHFALRAPCDGRLFAPPTRSGAKRFGFESQFWSGNPMDDANRGAWLQEGTVLAIVGDPSGRVATLLLEQQEIELIRLEQEVSFLLPDHPRGSVKGRVIEVATAPVIEVPNELAATGLANASGSNDIPRYQVRVKLEARGDSIPVRLTGRAKITVDSASIFERLSRFLSDSFG